MVKRLGIGAENPINGMPNSFLRSWFYEYIICIYVLVGATCSMSGALKKNANMPHPRIHS